MHEGPIDPSLLSALIPRTRDGDREARDELLSQLRDYLLQIANEHLDAKLRQKNAGSDIVQVSFVRIVESFEHFHGTNSHQLLAWIRQIVINETRTARRRFKTGKRNYGREEPLDAGDAGVHGQLVDKNPTPSSSAMRAERLAQFHAALSELPPDQATIIKLRSLDRLSFSDAGKQMNRSAEAASQLWYRAIVRFEEALSRRGASPP